MWEGDGTGRERGESPQAEEKREDKMAGWQTALQPEGGCIIIVEEEETMGTSSHTEMGGAQVRVNQETLSHTEMGGVWKMNGTDLLLDSDPRYSLMAGNLVINTPVRARDSGSYQCLATNPRGTVISREALLRFGYLHEFSPDERSPLTVTEGVGFTIPCNPPQHYPGLSYRWLHKEFPEFVPAGNGRWFVSQVTGNLYVARADLPDVGNYSCFATSRIDFITKSVFSKATLLRVNSDASHRKYSPSIKVRFPSETYALAGQTAQLECFAYGK
ncbi:Contactin-2 [Acipenser ruthenus]|uniref:Contactin-2 n=1 Tax=Acipenser ruthenus TaxID=7906 RepID=A0A444ULV9_ACIRT|nr:Contactin-2 [Acipenser ruthenus]